MLKKLKKKKNNKGFTLVELLVVIAIIGILAVVAVPSLFKQMDKAKATQVTANVKAIQTEVMTEYASSSNDATLVTNIGNYIGKEIYETGKSKGKLGETYVVTDEDSAKEGAGITLTVTFENTDSGKSLASSLAKQLGITTVSDNIVTYSIDK